MSLWCVVRGVVRDVCGAWCAVYGVWCMVCDVRGALYLARRAWGAHQPVQGLNALPLAEKRRSNHGSVAPVSWVVEGTVHIEPLSACDPACRLHARSWCRLGWG